MARTRRMVSLLLLLTVLGLAVAGCKVPPERHRERVRVKFILTDVDLAEAVAIAILADYFGWDVDLVIVVMREHDLGLDDLVALFVLLDLAKNKDIDFVVGLRGEGHGWGEIAHRLGIHPGTFNKLRRRILGPSVMKGGKWESDKEFQQGLFIVLLSDCFGVKAPSIRKKFEEGNSLPDLLLALALGKRSGVGWTELMEKRQEKGKPWLEMAEGMEVDLGELDSISEKIKAPKDKEDGANGKDKGKGKGKAED